MMLRRTLSTWMSLILLMLTACASEQTPAPATANTAVTEAAPSPLAESDLVAHANLRFDCGNDSDCPIMDIGNCCGHYPACVNVNSQVDPRAVTDECTTKGLGSVDLSRAGRAGDPWPATQGAASNVYSLYMSERQRGDAGQVPRPEGWRLSSRHAALRVLTVSTYAPRRAPYLPAGQAPRDPPGIGQQTPVGICGFPITESCVCRAGRCEPASRAGGEAVQ